MHCLCSAVPTRIALSAWARCTKLGLARVWQSYLRKSGRPDLRAPLPTLLCLLLGVNSIDELVARARAEPGKLSWAATAGLPQFVFAGFAKSAGLDMVQIGYRDFTPALQDLAEARIQVAATGLLPLLPFARAGKV